MDDKCFCDSPGFEFLGCLQDPTDGSLDTSVSLFMSSRKKMMEVATNKAGFYINILYCPFCGKQLQNEKDKGE